jgi:hypothetical protein
MSASTISNATMSNRTRLLAINAAATPINAKTKAVSPDIEVAPCNLSPVVDDRTHASFA